LVIKYPNILKFQGHAKFTQIGIFEKKHLATRRGGRVLQIIVCTGGCVGESFWKQKKDEEQGDQIGQNFAHWAIVFFVYIFENYKRSENIGQLFPTR
jgi:hypothetical protein